MICYNSYYVEGCEIEEISHRFLRVILSYSDVFSLIFFRYRQNEKTSKSAAMIKKKLAPFKLFSQDVNEWPGTKTLNERGHIYRMITYRANIDVLPTIEEVATLWDWDYPLFPMDPCFYKNGYAWFSVSSHEHWNKLILGKGPSFPLISDLESIGVTLIPGKKVKCSDIYYNSKIAEMLL